MGKQEEIMGIQDDITRMRSKNSPSKIEGVAGGRGSMTGDGIIPLRPFGALPLSQGESLTCHTQLCDITN